MKLSNYSFKRIIVCWSPRISTVVTNALAARTVLSRNVGLCWDHGKESNGQQWWRPTTLPTPWFWCLFVQPRSSKAASPRFFSLAKVTTISFRDREGSSGSNVCWRCGDVTSVGLLVAVSQQQGCDCMLRGGSFSSCTLITWNALFLESW
jgi:hypothetical protein